MSERTVRAEITELCEFAVLADRVRVAEILALPRAELNWRLAAALAASGATVDTARSTLAAATIANALADDQRTDLTRSN
jgi:hypothetical protein